MNETTIFDIKYSFKKIYIQLISCLKLKINRTTILNKVVPYRATKFTFHSSINSYNFCKMHELIVQRKVNFVARYCTTLFNIVVPFILSFKQEINWI